MKWDAKLLNWPFVTRQKEKKKKKKTQPSLCERQPMIVRRAILPLFFHQCGGLWHPTRQQFQLKLLSCPIPVDCRLAAFFLNKISFIIVLFKSWDSTSFFYFIYRHLSMNSKNENRPMFQKRFHRRDYRSSRGRSSLSTGDGTKKLWNWRYFDAFRRFK